MFAKQPLRPPLENEHLVQRFPTFSMLQPSNTLPHVVVTPDHKKISLPLYNCEFAAVMNRNINIWYVTLLLENHRLRTIDLV